MRRVKVFDRTYVRLSYATTELTLLPLTAVAARHHREARGQGADGPSMRTPSRLSSPTESSLRKDACKDR